MAKQCTVARNQKRERMSANQAAKRAELKALISNPATPFADRIAARDSLNSLAKNGSKIRVRTRCQLTGRGRGVHAKFKLCRNKLREMSSLGMLPGVVKSSW